MIEAFQNLFSPPRHMILLVIAAWFGLTLAERRSEGYGIRKDDLNNISFYGMIAFIIGGRLTYVLQHFEIFGKSPSSIISINPDLFDTFGALVVAAIVAFAYGQRKNLGAWNILDALTPLFAVIAIGLGLSHLAAKTAFGIPTDLPWGIEMWNAIRHPAQIYDIIASSLILILVWRFKPSPHPGIAFLIFVSLTVFSQIILQAFRADYTILFYNLRQEQVLAWVVLLACFILIEIKLKPIPKTNK